MAFLPEYFYIIVLSFLASLTVYTNTDPAERYLKLFPPYLLITIMVEYYANYLGNLDKSNSFVYNPFLAFEFCFYLFIITRMITSKVVKKIIWVITILFAIGATIHIAFFQRKFYMDTNVYVTGCLLVVVFSMYYFFELFRYPKSVKLARTPAFWICTGILFFYCCGFPLYGMITTLMRFSKLVISNFDSLAAILNIALYSLFTIAFLCRLKIRKYTLLSS